MRDALPTDARAIAALLSVLGYPTTAEEAGEHLERFFTDPASRLQVAVSETDQPIGSLG